MIRDAYDETLCSHQTINGLFRDSIITRKIKTQQQRQRHNPYNGNMRPNNRKCIIKWIHRFKYRRNVQNVCAIHFQWR